MPLYPIIPTSVTEFPTIPMKSQLNQRSFQSHHVPIIPWLPDRLACHTISHRLLQNIYIHYCMTSTPLSILHLSHYYTLPSHRLSYQTTSHRLSYYSHAAGRRESLWNPITSTVYMYIYIYVCVYIYIYTYIHIYIYIYMYIYIHYITLHHITFALCYITLHLIALHYITLHYITEHTYICILLYTYIYICVCVCCVDIPLCM